MLPSITSAVLSLDTAHLASFVRQATGCMRLELANWHASLIHGGATTHAQVYRVLGQGLDQGRTVPWSLVLKEWRQREADDRPSARNYWKREALAYQSGLLASATAGLRPPRCFGVCEQSETTIWLALEDMESPQPQPWRPTDFAQAAEHLGQFNRMPGEGRGSAPRLAQHRLAVRRFTLTSLRQKLILREAPGGRALRASYDCSLSRN
jgi:hypothetical protein